jgi:hypothetical protein
LKIYVDPKLLKKAPLTAYEKMLLERIDIKEEKLTKVAEDLHKSKGTISVQHKKATERCSKWIEQLEKKIARSAQAASIEKTLKDRLDQLAESMLSLEKYNKYLKCLAFVADTIGPYRQQNCKYVEASQGCKKLASSDPKLCAFCTFYADNTEQTPDKRRPEPEGWYDKFLE